MRRLRDSGRVLNPSTSLRDAAQGSGLSVPFSGRDLLDADDGPQTFTVNCHLKILTQPTIDLEDMIAEMQVIFDTADVRMPIGSRQNLTGSDFTDLLDLNVGQCAGNTTTEQNDLFDERDDAGKDDLVIYFVRSTVPAFNGCGSHPDDQPGCVVAQGASLWTLAHEVGHVLDLPHISGEQDQNGNCVTPNFTRLMTGCSTNNITSTPTLSSGEIDTVQGSDYAQE